MKRLVRNLLLSLLIGVAISLLVAWTCAARADLHRAGAIAGTAPAAESSAAIDEDLVLWRRFGGTTLPPEADVETTVERAVGVEDLTLASRSLRYMHDRWHIWTGAEWRLVGPDDSYVGSDYLVEVRRAGWPRTSVIGAHVRGMREDRGGNPWYDSHDGQFELPLGKHGSTLLPIRPTLGLLVNAALFGLPFFVLMTGSRTMRRGWRRYRRRCLDCGYPVADVERCSECGRDVPGRRAA